jgi:hypothetical protein
MLIIQELQIVKYIKATQYHLQISLSSVIYYVMIVTNKRCSYPRVAVIRIDVHLTGETRSTLHTLSTLDSRRVPDHTSHVVHVGNLSLVTTRSKQTPTLGGSLGD